jgi:hypothetical protein
MSQVKAAVDGSKLDEKRPDEKRLDASSDE